MSTNTDSERIQWMEDGGKTPRQVWTRQGKPCSAKEQPDGIAWQLEDNDVFPTLREAIDDAMTL